MRQTALLPTGNSTAIAARVADRAHVLHRGRVVVESPAAGLPDDEALRAAYLE